MNHKKVFVFLKVVWVGAGTPPRRDFRDWCQVEDAQDTDGHDARRAKRDTTKLVLLLDCVGKEVVVDTIATIYHGVFKVGMADPLARRSRWCICIYNMPICVTHQASQHSPSLYDCSRWCQHKESFRRCRQLRGMVRCQFFVGCPSKQHQTCTLQLQLTARIGVYVHKIFWLK